MKRRFPIFLKVILLGIGVSILTAGAAITVSYFNHKKSAEASLINNIDNSLDEVDYLFSDSPQKGDYMSDLEIVKGYVQDIYDADTEHKKLEDFDSFEDFAAYYADRYPWIYPSQGGMGLSQQMLIFKNAFMRITNMLTNAQISSGSRSAFLAFNDDENTLVMLSDSRMNRPSADPFFQVPGSFYTIKDTDYYVDEKYPRHVGLMLSGYRTRAHVIMDDTVKDEIVATVFIEYDFSKVDAESMELLQIELLILGLSSLILVLIYALFSYYLFARNINKLSAASEQIKQNLIDKKMDEVVEVKIRSNDEIRVLADSFNEMEKEIINYTNIIAQEALEKEKINAELAVASKIQLDALPPSRFDDGDVSILASIKTAKEVGGDFYDYFYIDDNRICFLIADVSGKGIPASLFMMKGKELLKSAVQSYKDLAEAVKYVNMMLTKNNKELLFITSFVGVYNIEKHELVYINCGHEKPYIISKGKLIKLDGESNIPLGIDDKYAFIAESRPFGVGDRLFMFTDGLNESINDNNEEFGYQRVEEILTKNASASLYQIFDSLTNELDKFVGDKEQFDDVTMLLVNANDGELKLHYQEKEYRIIEDITDKFMAFYPSLSPEVKGSAGIIIDEIVNNYISYEKREDLEVDVSFKVNKKELEMVFSCNGNDYNPFANHKEKYYEKFHNELEEGGFGLSIIKDLSKSHSYEYKDGRSYIKIVLAL